MRSAAIVLLFLAAIGISGPALSPASATVQLTVPLPVPNVTRIKVEDYRGNDDHMMVTVSLRPNAAGDPEAVQRERVYRRFYLRIVDAPALSDTLAIETAPGANPYTSQVSVVPRAVDGAFSHALSALLNVTPKTAAAAKKAIETSLVADGIIFAGTVQ